MRHSAGTWSGKTSEVPAFRLELQTESASRNPHLEWDTRLSVPASHHIRDAGFCAFVHQVSSCFWRLSRAAHRL